MRGRKNRKTKIYTGNLKQVYLLYGEEGYLKRQYGKRLVQAMLPEGDTMNYACFEGKNTNIKEVMDLAETLRNYDINNPPFFSNTGSSLMTFLTAGPFSGGPTQTLGGRFLKTVA